MGNALLAPEESPLILIVDDEDMIRKSLEDVLSDEGFRTITASNGADALEIVTNLEPDLVFLDIWMPGWDGIETLERIKAARPITEVIVISGHATISNALDATRRGAFDFIEKPLSIDSVLLCARRALQKKRALEQPVVEGAPSLFTHPGLSSRGMSGQNLGQRTLKRGALLYGQCLHSGQKSGLVLEPLPKDSGVHFVRIGGGPSVPAFVDHVQSTGFATTIRQELASAATIEHLMAALHAYRISNLLVKCNAEVPIFDGSALEFCRVIEEAGIEEQGGEWFEIAPNRALTVAGGGNDPRAEERISIEPSDVLSLRYELLYPEPVGRQVFEYTYDGIESFKREIAPARTFGFMRDIAKLQSAGLAAGGRLNNFILIGDDKVINTELRFPEELARHKILDAIGDLFLLGRPLRARIQAVMTGHSDNIKLLKELRSQIG